MKFFIPNTKTSESAEQIYEAIKAFAKDNLNWNISEQRIFHIEYSEKGKYYQAEVGKKFHENNEIVFAILKSNTFLVCTLNRGVKKDIPIQIGIDEVSLIEYFNGEKELI